MEKQISSTKIYLLTNTYIVIDASLIFYHVMWVQMDNELYFVHFINAVQPNINLNKIINFFVRTTINEFSKNTKSRIENNEISVCFLVSVTFCICMCRCLYVSVSYLCLSVFVTICVCGCLCLFEFVSIFFHDCLFLCRSVSANICICMRLCISLSVSFYV